MWAVDPLRSAAIVLLVVLPALCLRWLSISGAIAAFVVGWVTFTAGGLQAAGVLLAFFVTSSALSRWRAERKRRMESLTARGAQRGAVQVLANGGIATLCVALYGLTSDTRWWLAFVGAYAAANADTWSSEVGVLSRTPPRHILTGRLLRAGDSGGVTLVGLLAGCAGSAVVAGVAWLVYPVPLQRVVAVALGGIVGNLLDSVLGGALQARYRCVRCGEAVERREHCGSPAQYIAGWRWLNNDVVNLLCTLAGGVAGFWAGEV